MSVTKRILTIIRRALERGQTVEIDGLGTFLPAAGGACEFVAEQQPRVFIAYVEEDLALARRLREGIEAAGFVPWMDKDQLLPGQDWPRAIRRAIQISDVFVACFSARSIVKHGSFQSELRWALRCARQMPLEQTFVIPVRFEPCSVPRQIQERMHYVDLYPDWAAGMKKLNRAILKEARAGQKPGCTLIPSADLNSS